MACTLPRDQGKPFSRWSIKELTQAVKDQGIAPKISVSSVQRWLKQEKIKPWQVTSWQKPTDPRFLERAVPVLNLYEQASTLQEQGHIVVCADEKTSLQARRAQGGTRPAVPGSGLKVGDRYERKGALQLFAALMVSTGKTLARCFERKCFVDFQAFLQTLFASFGAQGIRCLHLILDNGPTHAPKRLESWIQSLKLPFQVQVHWLPVHASWLDQVELIFNQVQKKVLTPNDFKSIQHLEQTLMAYFDWLNLHPKPIRWTYTAPQLQAKLQPLAASVPPLAVVS